jgi:hypothetical protein
MKRLNTALRGWIGFLQKWNVSSSKNEVFSGFEACPKLSQAVSRQLSAVSLTHEFQAES